MAEKSYTEDKYGIVQTVLPAIFVSFLDLHEVSQSVQFCHSKYQKKNVQKETSVCIFKKSRHAF